MALPLVMVVVASGCWSQYRGDLSHSGNQANEFAIGSANASTLAEAWIDTTGSAVSTAPTVANGVTYVGAADGNLSAFDAAGIKGCSAGPPKTCAPLWTGAVGVGALRTSPAVAGGVVYIQGRDTLVAFDANGVNGCTSGPPVTCAPLWTSVSLGDVRSSPTVAGGMVFTTGSNGLLAFDAAAVSGCAGTPKVCSPVWSASFVPGWDASPTVAAGRVFVAGATSVAAFDAAGVSGCLNQLCAPLWSVNGSYSSPAVVGGTVFLAGGDHGLAAFDAAGVTHCMGVVCVPLWTGTLSVAPGEHVDPPAIANGVAYVNVRGSIFAFDTVGYLRGSDRCMKGVDLCTPLWQTGPGTTASDVVSGAPALGNRVLYAGGDERLTAFDAAGTVNCASFPKSCDPLWRSPAATAGFDAPVVSGGTLFAGSDDGVHAFRTSATPTGPTLGSVAPDAAVGRTTTVTLTGTNLDPALTIDTSIPGATVGAPVAQSAVSFTVAVTVPATTAAGQYAVSVQNPDQRRATRTVVVVGGTSGPEIAARSGISAFPGSLWESPADRDADAQAVADAGVGWTALDLDWKSIQGSSTDWGWARGVLNNGGFDGAVRAARSRGLKILGSITYSPKWASPNCADQNGTYVGHCFPDAAHVVDFANFARAAAERYGSQSTVADPLLRGSITDWQIWNEPNHQEFSLPRPDPGRYAAMLRAAYPAIKGADPTATVITGGTAPSGNSFDAGGQTEFAPTTWLLALYDRGAGNSFDAIAHHPYSFPWNPLDDADFNGFTQARYLYLVMAAHGDVNKKVWGTEMGAPTGSVPLADPNQPCFGRSMTETEQSQWLHDYYLGWNTNFRAFTGPMIWKATRDDPPDVTKPANTQLWNNLGLLRFDHSRKPAFTTFQQMTAAGISGPRQGPHCWK